MKLYLCWSESLFKTQLLGILSEKEAEKWLDKQKSSFFKTYYLQEIELSNKFKLEDFLNA